MPGTGGGHRDLRPAPRPDPAAVPTTTARVVNIANVLTLLRLLLVPVFLVLLYVEGGDDTGWRVAAFVAFATAAITDRVDGSSPAAEGWSPTSARSPTRSRTRR